MFTVTEKLEAVARELKYRRSVYKRRVDLKQMSQDFADRQIALFEEIESDYKALASKERLI